MDRFEPGERHTVAHRLLAYEPARTLLECCNKLSFYGQSDSIREWIRCVIIMSNINNNPHHHYQHDNNSNHVQVSSEVAKVTWI